MGWAFVLLQCGAVDNEGTRTGACDTLGSAEDDAGDRYDTGYTSLSSLAW